MGILEILTIIFVVLKLIGAVDWSWWLVLLPELIAVGIYVAVTSFVGIGVINVLKRAVGRK
jgi:hypothetical protein